MHDRVCNDVINQFLNQKPKITDTAPVNAHNDQKQFPVVAVVQAQASNSEFPPVNGPTSTHVMGDCALGSTDDGGCKRPASDVLAMQREPYGGSAPLQRQQRDREVQPVRDDAAILVQGRQGWSIP